MTALHDSQRPTSFAEIIGQDDVVGSLKKVVADKRAKTFLFTGPSGCGKTTIARILANKFAEGKSTVANLVEIDAATNSGVDAMRAIASGALYRAIGSSPIKAIVVDECHRLSAAAWSSMLKPIEEPPAHVYWMLLTTDPGKVPKTILTRCLRYDLKAVDEEALLELLVRVADAEGFDTPDAVLEAIAEGAGGSPRQALVFLEVARYAKTAAEARKLTKHAGQSLEALDLCRFLASGRGHNWAEAMKYLKALEGMDAEGIRITICNYLQAVLAGTKGDAKAAELLALLGCFTEAYNSSDRQAPLMISIGLALGLDRR